MFITTKPKFQYKQLQPSDPNFRFSPDGIVMVPRAGFKINERCPREYKLIIAQCIDNGWLQPVAHIKDHELTFDILTEGN
jgi:hypothetical protein